MELLSKFGNIQSLQLPGITDNPNCLFPLPSPGKTVVVLGDNSLYAPVEVLSLLLSSHQRRF